MAKPANKIMVTMTRSEWNLFMARLTSHDVEIRNKAAIEFEKKAGLS